MQFLALGALARPDRGFAAPGLKIEPAFAEALALDDGFPADPHAALVAPDARPDCARADVFEGLPRGITGLG